MKKIILSVVALMAIGTLSAQKVTILSGSNDFLKEADALASFDVDLSDCVVVDFGTGHAKIRKELGTLEEYLDANGKDKKRYTYVKGCNNFDVATAFFNRANKKGLHLLVGANGREAFRMTPSKKSAKMYKQGFRWEDSENLKYNIVFHIDSIDMGSGAAQALFGGGALTGSIPGADGGARATCWGEVFEIATDELVCEFNLGRFYGDGNVDEAVRFYNAISAAISAQLPKLAKLKK